MSLAERPIFHIFNSSIVPKNAVVASPSLPTVKSKFPGIIVPVATVVSVKIFPFT
jgi:hypothetical protein